MRIDINADVGESSGAFVVGDDAGLMRVISSANVAAGVHAGDPTVLRETIRLARSLGVAVGAHPGLPDREGFGRRELRLSAREVEDLVLYQVAVVAGVATAEGTRLRHVKLHGALYTMAARDAGLADAVVRAIAAIDPALVVFGPARSALIEAARVVGLTTAAEVFADRACDADGHLVPRSQAGSVLTDPHVVVPRALRMVREGTVVAVDGQIVNVVADTICVHSDTPGCAGLASRMREAFDSSGVQVGPIQADRGAGSGSAA